MPGYETTRAELHEKHGWMRKSVSCESNAWGLRSLLLDEYTKVYFHTSISPIKKQSDPWTCERLCFTCQSALVIIITDQDKVNDSQQTYITNWYREGSPTYYFLSHDKRGDFEDLVNPLIYQHQHTSFLALWPEVLQALSHVAHQYCTGLRHMPAPNMFVFCKPPIVPAMWPGTLQAFSYFCDCGLRCMRAINKVFVSASSFHSFVLLLSPLHVCSTLANVNLILTTTVAGRNAKRIMKIWFELKILHSKAYFLCLKWVNSYKYD